MSSDQSYPFPQVFLVEGGGGAQQSNQPPSLIPCWSFPPAREQVRSRRKSRGCMGVGYGAALVVLMLFLLVFAALGLEAFQIQKMKKQLEVKPETLPNTEQLQRQIAHKEPELDGEKKDDRASAHVIGRIESVRFSRTLRWEPQAGRAFISGGVVYRPEDGALQVNQTGIYHIYSRVELVFNACSPTSSFLHTVFVRRAGRSSPLTLMEAHRAGFCAQQLSQSWTAESYLGSALQLQRYDRVFVNVSHPSYLSHTHYGNFFGLYKI